MQAIVLVVGCTLVAGGAAAADTNKPAINTEANRPSAPVPGKNSFTLAEAKARMEKAGYTVANDPIKDAAGIWRAEATRGGTAVRLLLDYQGNVFQAAAPSGPVRGPTKLTSDKAQHLMEQRGYTLTSIPIKDDQGIWYAEGHLGEQSAVQVMVDHEGNVFESTEFSGHPNSAPGTPPGPFPVIKPAPLPGSQAASDSK